MGDAAAYHKIIAAEVVRWGANTDDRVFRAAAAMPPTTRVCLNADDADAAHGIRTAHDIYICTGAPLSQC